MATGMVLPMAILAYCTWAVYMGALTSMQAACPQEITILTGGTAECKTVYRYWWFIMSYECVIVVGLTVVALLNKLHNLKVAFVGLFAVGLMLFINASNEFLTRADMGYFKDGPQLHRIRTITAGSIMTATANAFVIIALGLTEDTHVAEVIVEKPGASAV